MFSTLIARFAAWSVILVILFTGYLEIFYYKTGIKRVVQFRSTDFQAPVFLELLVFPYVYFSRYLTNFVRSKYDKLPKVVPAPGTEDLADLDQSSDEEEDPFRPYDFETRSKRQQQKKAEQKTGWFEPQKGRPEEEHSLEKEPLGNSFNFREPEAKEPQKDRPEPASSSSAERQGQRYEEANLFENNDYDMEHRQKDREPKSQSDAASLSDSLAEIFKRSNENFSESVDRTKLDDISFAQEVDYSASLKHVDRRTGQVQYLSMDDLDEKLEDLSARMDDASEMYQDTGDPIYLATIEECRNAMSYWQTRRVELHQKMQQQTSF